MNKVLIYCSQNPVNFIDPLGLSFGSSFSSNWRSINRFFFNGATRLSRTVLGFITRGATARTMGTLTPIQAIGSILRDPGISGIRGVATLGVTGTLGSAALNVGVNALYSGVALEVGVTLGSVVSAVPVYDTDQSITDWWDLLHNEELGSCQ